MRLPGTPQGLLQPLRTKTASAPVSRSSTTRPGTRRRSIKSALQALTGEHAAVLFIVDRAATEGDFPILVVDLSPEDRSPFRCIAREIWGVDNNLNLANMDWEEFAANADSDGVHRGFGD
jgi:hypothetical protein